MKNETEATLSSEFSSIWRETFGETPPLGHILRHDFHANWTRFHALPESKRYAETDVEKNIILSRANSLAAACFDELEVVWVVTARYGDTFLETHDLVAKLNMEPAFSWTDLEEEPEDQIQTTFYVKSIPWKQSSLDWLFADIAEDQIRAILFSQTKNIVFAPYDGGFDIICPRSQKIRGLEVNFGTWMSERPDKL